MLKSALLLLIITLFAVPSLCVDEVPTPPNLEANLIRAEYCYGDFPHMSVGDFNISKLSHLRELQKGKKDVLVAVTVGYCTTCCKFEPLLMELMQYVKQDPQFKDLELHRVDVQKAPWFQEEVPVDRYPALVFFHKGKPKQFHYIWENVRIKRWLEQSRQPLTVFKTAKDVDRFLNEQVKDSDGAVIHSVKVLGMFFDPAEMEEEVKMFKLAAERSAGRGEMYFGLLTGGEVKKVKNNHRTWFDEMSLSSVIVQRIPGKIDSIDLTKAEDMLQNIIYVKALKLVDEITFQTHQFYSVTNKPAVMFLVDMLHKFDEYKAFVHMLEDLAIEFDEVVHIIYTDSIFNPHKKDLLGITEKGLPAMAFYKVEEDEKVAYPATWPLNTTTIKQFIMDYFTLKRPEMIRKYNATYQHLLKTPIYTELEGIQELNATSFQQLVDKRKKDTLVVFFNSRNHSQEFNTVAKHASLVQSRFKDLKIKTVSVYIYDLFYHESPIPYMDTSDDFMVLYPFDKKKGKLPPRKFGDEKRALHIMKFIEKHAGVPFKLPEHPHVPEIHLEEFFYKQAIEENFRTEDYIYREDL